MARRDVLRFENAQIIFRNFGGNPTKFNTAGGIRSFHVLIEDPAVAQQLAAAGWNVKQSGLDTDDTIPYWHMEVKVSYDVVPPKVITVTQRGIQNLLNEETIGELDYLDIAFCDIEINPYPWNVNGKTGIKAYLKTLYANIVEDAFAEKYANMLPPEM